MNNKLKKKFTFIFKTAIFVTLITFVIVIFNSGTLKDDKDILPKNNKTILENYEKEWNQVKKFENKGLPKSALKRVNSILEKAKSENNGAQIIKTLIHILKYKFKIEETVNVLLVRDIEKSIESYSSPAKELLYSVVAELYWNYYAEHRYQFAGRTETTNFENDDITTWSIKQLVKHIANLYLDSLKNSDKLKKYKSKDFQDIIRGSDIDFQLRPTLYDFLTHRALTFFQIEEVYATVPAYKFILDKPIYLSDAKKFATIKINNQLKSKENVLLSLKYNTILLFQKLIKFHLESNNITALVTIDLERLQFVRNNSVMENGESLYIKALENMYKKYQAYPISVDIAYEMALYYFNSDKKDGKKKAFDLCNKVINSKSSSQFYGKNNAHDLIETILTKELDIQTERVNIPNKPSLALVSYKNIDKLYFKIIKLKKKDIQKSITIKDGNNGLIKFYNTFPAINEWEEQLPKDQYFNNHSTEIIIPPLPKGYYILLSSTSKNFTIEKNAVTYSVIKVSNISFITRHNNKSSLFEVLVSNRETGKPLANVKVQTYEKYYNYKKQRYEYKKKKRYTSNENGYLKIDIVEKSFAMEFTYNDDYLFTDDQYYQSKYYDYYDESKITTFFFTDRSIYRPGQTIYFKGLVVETNKDNRSKIVPGYKTTVTFYDVNWQTIKTIEVKANEFGSFSGEFVAPSDRLNGTMTIVGAGGSQTTISVEEYKRPKFEVTFDKLEGSFKVNEKVSIYGKAKAYANFNIDNADVRYRVVRNVEFPYWYWYWGYMPDTKEVEIINGTTKTDTKGEFTVDFQAIPDFSIPKENMPVFRYTIYADVTDINGETRSSQITVNVGYVALKFDIDIPDLIEKNDKNNFDISSLNLNNEYEPSKGNIVVYKLESGDSFYRKRMWNKPDIKLIDKKEFKKNFPHLAYDNEDNFHYWKKQKKVLTTQFNTNNSKIFKLKNLSQLQSGKYLLVANTKDKFGKAIEIKKYFTLYSKNTNNVAVPTAALFFINKSTLEPKEILQIECASSYKDVTLFYEIESKNKITKRERIILSNEQKTIKIPVVEDYRGGFNVHLGFVKESRYYGKSFAINVPWSNKKLNIEFETFRDKLYPGQKEEWRIKISGPDKERVMAEMVATLYDASLNAFKPHNWYFNVNPYYYQQLAWEQPKDSFSSIYSVLTYHSWYSDQYYNMSYSEISLKWFDLELGDYYYMPMDKRRYKKTKMKNGHIKSSMMYEEMEEADEYSEKLETEKEPNIDKTITTNNRDTLTGKQEEIQIRKNFQETAFFYPHLKTNENGEIIISFTIPEALTRWQLLGFAHTKDLKTALIRESLVTQKELMVMPNIPRFFREGDTIYISSKISNLSKNNLTGIAKLELFSALTMEQVDAQFDNNNKEKQFSVKSEESTVVTWKVKIPEGIQAVTYRITAKTGKFSDGEEAALPILTNRMLVTESMPFSIREKGTKKFTFDKLINSDSSKTLRHQSLTLEYTPNPVWYAVQALPYLMEYPYECVEQTFSRFYANSIASHIVNSSPKIKKIFEQWEKDSERDGKNSKALLSNLQKNEELKSLLLQETPWVLEAQSEAERKKRIGLLFDLHKMSKSLNKALRKVKKAQTINGGFSWFTGLPEDRYMTQYIIEGFAHLKRLNIDFGKNNSTIETIIKNGIKFLDNMARKDYEYLVEHKYNISRDNLSYLIIHYLYTRSFYPDLPIDSKNKKALSYWKSQAKKYWLDKGLYLQGLIALSLYRYDEKKTANDIIASLKENSIENEKFGMYWKENEGGYYWYQAPIETQALLIEAFLEITNDVDSVEAMKVWLLRQKQVQDWKTTKATTEACYALLLQGTSLISEDNNIKITLGKTTIDSENIKEKEAGTGYFKISWDKDRIKKDMGNITITQNINGLSWGAVYWQYFENLDKITPHKTPLRLNKKLFLQKDTPSGPVLEPIEDTTVIKVGDIIKVRIELRVDRNMEYIHMKDMRASALEPVTVISSYKYQDGLWYYQTTKDASTNFFITWLPKGTYVFEYSLRVAHRGDFSNGITTIQSMYAPEFSSHSEGVRIKIR